MIVKCIKCSREADYDSPENYCKFHWFEWWYEGWEQEFAKSEFQEAFAEENQFVVPLLKLIRENSNDHSKMEELHSQYQEWLYSDED